MRRSAIICSLVIIAWATPATAQQRFVEYEVKAGDTCASIAEEVYGDAARYDLVHSANELGDPPHDLKPGQKLKLPKVREALLRQGRGPVMFKSPDSQWSKAGVGLELYRAWRLNTLEQAGALVEFRDATELALRENTLVVIYGPSSGRATQQQTHAKLESGALRAKLGQLAGKVTVETESSSSDLAGGLALLTVDENLATRVANHGGKAIVVRGKAGGSVSVDEGFGSKVNKGERPKPPKPLPPTPGWQPGPSSFPTFADATVTAAWAPVSEAKEYFVEVTADARGIRVMQSAFVPSDVTNLEVQGLPPGDYYATVSAIDDDRFESIPSERLTLSVVSFGFERNVLLEPKQFLAGAQIQSPTGLQCGVADGPAAESFELVPTKLTPVQGTSFPGYREPMQVRCVDGDGNPTELQVEAVIPPFTVEGPTVSDDQISVPAGRAVSVDLLFDGQVAPLTVTVPTLEASFLGVAADRGRVRLADGGSGAESQMSLAIAGQDVLTMDVSITTEVPAVIEPVHYELGGAVLVQGFGNTLGDPAASGGTLAALRATGRLLPSDYLSIGLMLDVGGVIDDGIDPVFGLGVEAIGSLPLERWRPFLSIGTEAWFIPSGRTTATFEGTAGIDYEIFYAQGLRLGARVALIQEDVDWLASVGAFAGYFWAF